MNKTKRIITGVASALLCVALITGSAFAISAAVASPMETAPVVTEASAPELLTNELGVVAVDANTDTDADTEGTPVLVQSGVIISEDGTVIVSGQGSVICMVGDDGILRFEDYVPAPAVLVEDGTVTVSGEGAVVYKVGEDGVVGFEDYSPAFVEGVPGEDDITADTAIAAATQAIQSKYALTDATIARFASQALLNVANPDEPVWSVVFNPVNNSDFSEIGCYSVTVNAKTGEVGSILSAADGIG